MIIINKLTFQHKKTVLEFTEDQSDPFEKKCTHGVLPEKIQSHIDAVATWLFEEHKAQYEEAQKQIPSGFDEGEEEGDGEAEDPTTFDEDPAVDPYDGNDYSDIKVPLHEGTQLPDFGGMEILHAQWFVRQYKEKKKLIEDVKYHYSLDLSEKLTLLNLKREAIKLLQG